MRLASLALLCIAFLASAGRRSKVCDKDARSFNARRQLLLEAIPKQKLTSLVGTLTI